MRRINSLTRIIVRKNTPLYAEIRVKSLHDQNIFIVITVFGDLPSLNSILSRLMMLIKTITIVLHLISLFEN